MRLKKQDKLALAERITSAILELVHASGMLLRMANAPGKAVIAKMGNIEVLHTTPFTGLRGAPAPYGMDIRNDGRGKVFSVWWDPFEIVRFNYGPWMNEILPGSYVE